MLAGNGVLPRNTDTLQRCHWRVGLLLQLLMTLRWGAVGWRRVEGGFGLPVITLARGAFGGRVEGVVAFRSSNALFGVRVG